MKTLILLAVLLFPVSALPQEPVKPVIAVTPVAAPDAIPAAAPTAKPVAPLADKVAVNDVVTDAQEVAAAVIAYKDAKKAEDKLAVRLGLMAMLAAIFKVLLSGLKLTSDFWKGKKGKLALRISTLVLGIGVAVASHFAGGEGWVSAMMLGFSGPLAISFHELFDIVVGLVQKKPEGAVA